MSKDAQRGRFTPAASEECTGAPAVSVISFVRRTDGEASESTAVANRRP
jgi:hypothetical protein